jgi:hypothetical protein
MRLTSAIEKNELEMGIIRKKVKSLTSLRIVQAEMSIVIAF